MKTSVLQAPGVSRGWVATLAGLSVLFWTLTAQAQSTEGIVVQGVGVAKGRPTQVEIAVTISADAELAADATVKYRDAKKRAISTMDGLRNPNLSLDFSGFSINNTMDAATQQLVQRGQIAVAPKTKIQVSEGCRLTVKDIDKIPPESLLDTLLKIVDTAKDAGFQISSGPTYYYNDQGIRVGTASSSNVTSMAAFKILDNSPLREQAYKAAIDDAKAKAQKLAEASGVKLGRVTGIQDNSARNTANVALPSATDEKSMLGSIFGDMTLRASLTIQFEIVK